MKKIGLLFFYTSFLCSMELPHTEVVMGNSNPVSVHIGSHSSQGRQPFQEDRKTINIIEHQGKNLFCIGVFDGHVGKNTAEFLKKSFFTYFSRNLKEENLDIRKALEQACHDCENALLMELKAKEPQSIVYDGSTALVSCYDPSENKLYVVTVGDSKGYFGTDSCLVTPEHRHTNKDEVDRIERAGGKIDKFHRVNGVLAVTRSIGDVFAKSKGLKDLVIMKPEYTEYVFGEHGGFYVATTDGFSDKVCDNKFFDYLKEVLLLSKDNFYKKYPVAPDYKSESYESSSEEDESSSDSEDTYEYQKEDKTARQIATLLVNLAKSKTTTDNTTAVVMFVGDYLNFIKEMNQQEQQNEKDEFEIRATPQQLEQMMNSLLEESVSTDEEKIERVSQSSSTEDEDVDTTEDNQEFFDPKISPEDSQQMLQNLQNSDNSSLKEEEKNDSLAPQATEKVEEVQPGQIDIVVSTEDKKKEIKGDDEKKPSVLPIAMKKSLNEQKNTAGWTHFLMNHKAGIGCSLTVAVLAVLVAYYYKELVGSFIII